MAAYLIVDVDDLLEHFRRRGVTLNVQELAMALRTNAMIAAGLPSTDRLRAVAVANWDQYKTPRGIGGTIDIRRAFVATNYEIFEVTRRSSLADALIMHYFSFDPDPVDELILATTSSDLIPLVRRVKVTRNARIRLWGADDILQGTEFADEVRFQPLDTLLGIQQTRNVSVYIDFENIAISLNEQGYTVNLDQLIESFMRQAKAHGQVVKLAAYAPWTSRGALPPIVDATGREVTDEAANRLLMSNIEAIPTLMGKNSADMRIASDVVREANYPDSADIFIVASGDRDFNDLINTLRQRGKSVILWAVHGATSRQLEKNGVPIEYVEEFTNLQTHQAFGAMQGVAGELEAAPSFTPSQWSSVILQFDRLSAEMNAETLLRSRLIDQLMQVGAVVSKARGEDLIAQAQTVGILRTVGSANRLALDAQNSIVERTRLIRDRIVMRVANTLHVREWEYVNYGFLLKGLAMDRELERPGMNYSDQWRSDWIDCLVREHILVRELVPHRHNPDDLVPVIKLPDAAALPGVGPVPAQAEGETESWQGIALTDLEQMERETADMVRRIVVSVEQFTSFRGFVWCPLGSLHRRLKAHDRGMSFQRAVEYLLENGAATVNEYPNPQSEFLTKGISLEMESPLTRQILEERNAFVCLLLRLYERNQVIAEPNVRQHMTTTRWDIPLWFSIMETENVLNGVPGRPGQYSLFRTHHTVMLVGESVCGSLPT